MLSNDYNIKSMCEILKVSSSEYYIWLKNKDVLNKDVLNKYEMNRKCLGELIINIHKRKIKLWIS